MRMRFILSETWTSLRRNASVLIQAQITKAKGDWYN